MATARIFGVSSDSGITLPDMYQAKYIYAQKEATFSLITGMTWCNGPDEDLGYLISCPYLSENRPQFWRSTEKTDASFLVMANRLSKQNFGTVSDAKTWLNNNGYWATVVVLPTVTTNSLTNITYSGATSGGNITNDGGGIITGRGVCWNTSGTPNISDSKTSDGTGSGLFTSNLTSLSASTLYYAMAYATNSVGTSYGEQQSGTTSVAPSQGPVTGSTTMGPGTMADLAGVGTQVWSNPNNAKVDDSSYATYNAFDGDEAAQSHYLKATNFGFTIPTNATINGILVEIKAKVSKNNLIFNNVRIIKGGTISSTTKKSGSVFSTEAYIPLPTGGTTTDKWGEEWIYSDINDINFGVVIQGDRNPILMTVSVNYIRITIYYTTS